jgi:LmeA-like phospholipid-binding
LEFLTIFLSSLITLIAPAGFVVDRAAQKAIRQQFKSVEQLEVRIDNAPSYQIVQGKVDRVRIAGRGLFLAQDIRLDTLELETDPIQLNARRLQRGRLRLEKPLRAGVRLVITQEDINRSLRSPIVLKRLTSLGISALGRRETRQRTQKYTLLNPRIALLANQRIQIQAELQEVGDPATLKILAESGIEATAGRQLRLVDPQVRLNDEAVPEQVLRSIVQGITEQSDLQQLEKTGTTARILQLQVTPKQINVAAFVQLAPQQPLR